METQKLRSKFTQQLSEAKLAKEDIPKSLKFLNAEHIRLSLEYGTDIISAYIVLANCFDERIELTLLQQNNSNIVITLYWAEPTVENPYSRGEQILWQAHNEP